MNQAFTARHARRVRRLLNRVVLSEARVSDAPLESSSFVFHDLAARSQTVEPDVPPVLQVSEPVVASTEPSQTLAPAVSREDSTAGEYFRALRWRGDGPLDVLELPERPRPIRAVAASFFGGLPWNGDEVSARTGFLDFATRAILGDAKPPEQPRPLPAEKSIARRWFHDIPWSGSR